MFTLVAMAILYVFGFVFLYGVIRVGVRHGIEDAEANRPEVLRRRQLTTTESRDFAQENAFLTNPN